MSQSKRFLFAMWDGGGNIPPALGIVRGLVERGHQVRVIGDPTLAEDASAAGAELTPWVRAPHRKSRRREDDLIKDYEMGSPIAMIRTYIQSFVGRPAPDWASETMAALESFHADALVADMTIPAAFIAAEALGIPVAGYSPNIWMLPTPGIPPLGPGFAPAKGPLGRMRDWLMRAITRRAFAPATPYINAVRSSYGLAPVKSVHDQMLAADEIYLLTSPRFDFTSPAMPAHVRYAGPVLDDPTWCQPWQSPWSAGDSRPLVLVGLSSTYQKQTDTLRNIVAALSALPVRALVTLGPTLTSGEVQGSENVVVVPTAPHATVLREAAVLVTHCGHGTTMRGLAAGVPLVCVPMGRDQNDTAARVVHHGAGVRISPKASVDAIRRAVQRVLAEPSFREGAARLRRAIDAREGCVDVVQSLERLAARRPQRSERKVEERLLAVHGI